MCRIKFLYLVLEHFRIEVERIMAYRCSKFNPLRLLSCLDNSKLKTFHYRDTVTLHQGQGNGNEHKHIYHESVYSHAKFECHSVKIVREGCLLGGVYVPCIYRMPGGVIVGDSGLCCCGPAFNV